MRYVSGNKNDGHDRCVDCGVVPHVNQRWGQGGRNSGSSSSIYTVLLGIFITIAVYALVPSSAKAQAGYPGGVRDPGLWYYCFAELYNPASASPVGMEWSPIYCENLLFQESTGGGGIFNSLDMVGAAAVVGTDTTGEYQRVQGYVVPSQHIRKYTYACDIAVLACHHGGSGSFTANAATSWSVSYFNTDATNFTLSSPSPASNACASASLDVVASYRASADDNFWLRDPVAGWSVAGYDQAAWKAEVNTSSDNRSAGAQYSCRITSWESWPAWLATNPEWVPGEGSLVPSPTPTGTPGGWDSAPWDPITDSVNAPEFDLGDPGVEVCTIIIPEYGWTWDSIEYGWEAVEFCSTEYDLTLKFFGVDVGVYLVTTLLLGGVGVLVSIIKRA